LIALASAKQISLQIISKDGKKIMAQYNRTSNEYLGSSKTLFETNMIADRNGDVISNFLIADGADKTAFGRIRTAGTRLLGEFRNMYGTYGPLEIVTKFETGGSQTVNLAQTNTLINVTDASGSRAVRQTRQYHSYIPGTTILGFISFTMSEPKTGLQQSVGIFDDSNGIFLRRNGSTVEFVIRKAGVDVSIVTQENWNIDAFDGTGDSKTVLDLTKSQVLVVDYQWLSVGRVRVGFDIDGRIFYAHYFNHANIVTEPYLFQPSLPVRWELKNTDETNGASSLMCIAYGVYIEGADSETGFDQAISNGITPVSITSSAQAGILAVRLKNTVNSQPMRAFARLKEWGVFVDNPVRYRVLLLQDSTTISGTPTWSSASPSSWCEFITNFTLTSATPANTAVIYDGYATGVLNKSSGASAQIDNRLAAIYQNFDSTDSMIFAIVAERTSNSNTNVFANMLWIEVK
jgi:hypothetical protein